MNNKKKNTLKLCEQEKLSNIKPDKGEPSFVCLECGRLASQADFLCKPKSLKDY